jgi:D-alanine-D-alanine ligase
MNVALVFNLIREEMLADRELDVIAEYDSRETIDALGDAIRSGGHEVIPIEADENVFENLKKCKDKIDIVFNVAEGMECECRESFVPMLCEMLDVPYSGSGPLTLAVCLDKIRTKQVVASNGIATPRWQPFHTPDEAIRSDFRYPLIVKLAAEGSSMGIDDDSVAGDEPALRRRLAKVNKKYPGKRMIVEEYIDGREFTVPLVGNDPPLVLPAVEVKFDKVPAGKPKIVFFRPDDDYASIGTMVRKARRDREMKNPDHYSKCPADLSSPVLAKLQEMAIGAFRAAECRDWCRMEFRLDQQGKFHFIEMNPIAGIDPSYYFPRSARAFGWDYNELINRILNGAIARYPQLSRKK